MRNFRRQLEHVIENYTFEPVLRQELLVNFLLVYLDIQPSFYWKDTDLEFIQKIEDLGFQIVIKNDMSIIVNPSRSKCVLNLYSNSSQEIFQSVFIFKRNRIETKHLLKEYNSLNLEEQLPKTVFLLNNILSSNQFLDFEVFLNVSCKNNL